MGNVKELDDAGFVNFVEENGLVLVDFSAEWCGPCRALTPLLEELSEELEGVAFARVDVDRNRETPGKFGIMSVPTMLVFRQGKLVDRMVGVSPKHVIEERLKKFME